MTPRDREKLREADLHRKEKLVWLKAAYFGLHALGAHMQHVRHGPLRQRRP